MIRRSITSNKSKRELVRLDQKLLFPRGKKIEREKEREREEVIE